MFNVGEMVERAKQLLGDHGAGQAAEAMDLEPFLESAGVDAEALAQMTPEDATSFLENAGWDMELLNSLEADGALQALLNRQSAE